ncbi:MAG: DMT family transporter [Bacteroidota bacterium]
MSDSFRNSYLFAAIIVVVGAILFSTKAVLIKLAYQHPIDSLSLLALRMLFSLPFFISILLFQKKDATCSVIKTSDWLKMATIGILGFYCASYLDFIGLQYISASLERMVLYIYPTLVLIISAIAFRKKITPIQLLALGITYVGIAIIFSSKISTVGNSNPLLGAFFVFFAALTYAMYLVGSGELLPRIGTRRFTSYSMIAAATVVLLHHAIANGFHLFNYPIEVYGIVLFMAVFATVFPTFMIAEGVRIIGANNAAIIGAIGPVSTIILAYLFLGEVMYPIQIVGTIIVISGVLLITLNKNKQKSLEGNG